MFFVSSVLFDLDPEKKGCVFDVFRWVVLAGWVGLVIMGSPVGFWGFDFIVRRGGEIGCKNGESIFGCFGWGENGPKRRDRSFGSAQESLALDGHGGGD